MICTCECSLVCAWISFLALCNEDYLDVRCVISQVDVFFVQCLILRSSRQTVLQLISNEFPQALTTALFNPILTSVSLYALLSLPLYVLPYYLLALFLSLFLFHMFYYLHPLLLIQSVRYTCLSICTSVHFILRSVAFGLYERKFTLWRTYAHVYWGLRLWRWWLWRYCRNGTSIGVWPLLPELFQIIFANHPTIGNFLPEIVVASLNK